MEIAAYLLRVKYLLKIMYDYKFFITNVEK